MATTLTQHRVARWVGFLLLGLLCLAPIARAADIPVSAKKFIVIDKLIAASKAKAVFVAKDDAIVKGAGTDVGDITVQFLAEYYHRCEGGAFSVPSGASDGTAGWVVNKSDVAKYVNKDAPAGVVTKVATVKPGKLLKLVAKERGDIPLEVFATEPINGRVYTLYQVENGAEVNRHCTKFTGCQHKLIAGDTGAKLVCKAGVGDSSCTAQFALTPLTCADYATTACEDCFLSNTTYGLAPDALCFLACESRELCCNCGACTAGILCSVEENPQSNCFAECGCG